MQTSLPTPSCLCNPNIPPYRFPFRVKEVSAQFYYYFDIITVFILLLQIQLSDERSSCKLTKKQNEKLKGELDRLHQEIIKYLF